ncbi:hypothetical protein D521_0659 [beta proteobacterium CB]|nr:hypothetical protein D521_0659 [beta proteobacterium CB]
MVKVMFAVAVPMAVALLSLTVKLIVGKVVPALSALTPAVVKTTLQESLSS